MSAPARTLHIVRRYEPLVGGTELYVRDLARAQVRAGHEVTVITLDRDVMGVEPGRLPANETLDGVSVRRLAAVGNRRAAMCLRPDVVAREIHRADVVHLHDLRFLVGTTAVTCRVLARPMILHTHGLLFHTSFAQTAKHLLLRYYYGPLLRLARARIVASSEPDRTTLLGHVPALTRRTVTLENGVDLSSLLRLERDPQPGALIVVGRLTPSKGVDDLLRALAHLTVTDWQLDVWGTEESGERLRLSLIVRSLGLEDRVVFHGAFNSDQLHHSLARASLAIFPSRAEGFGLALLEALAAGTPVLASDIPAHRALLGPDLADRVVDLTSPGAAAEEIVRHLTAAPATTTSLTERERARARSYDVGRLKRDIDALYIQLGLGI